MKGIIHRDIKPSNVLVTMHDGEPMPKVIDFGVAKATNTELTQKTLFTEYGQMVGTPAYMSPEQAEMSGLDIDTRSDIYSLGVLLYELLTGTTPFDKEELRSKGYAAMMRIIREKEPPRPSTRVSTLETAISEAGDHRKADLHKLGSYLRGEVDWIVMKCLEKNRERRYTTAAELADDLRRHLSGEVVQARPPSTLYRAQKFVRRHRGPVAALVALAIVMTLGIIGTTIGMTRAFSANVRLERALTDVKAERDRADAEANWSFRVASVLANRFQGKAQVDQFAKEWETRLNEVRNLIGPDDPDLIRQECLYAVWGWTLAWIESAQMGLTGDSAEAEEGNQVLDNLRTWGARVEQAYQRSADRFEPDDPLWAGLVNHNIQWLLTARGKTQANKTKELPAEAWEEIAPLYDDLVTSFSAIHGSHSAEALRMAAERVMAYQRAGQPEHAVSALRKYLNLRREGGARSRILDYEHEMIIRASRENPIVDPIVYGEFMRRYYTDAIQLFPFGSDACKMAHDQLVGWLTKSEGLFIHEDS
jgi:hypothetical protein